jgi:AcrR family transcriptional regulator
MTKNKIKEAACRQLAEKGYEKTTLSSIAKEVGIKTPSIYAFFKSKEDLFIAVYKDLVDDHFSYLKQTAENRADKAVKERLYHMLKDVCDYHLSQREKTASYTRLVFFLPPNLNDEVSKIFQDIEGLHSEILGEVFSKGMEEGVLKKQSLEDLVVSFLCLMDGIFLELFYYQEEKFKRRFEQVWSIYWNGICSNDELRQHISQ